jgi:Xaa-Pro aminopeptidase
MQNRIKQFQLLMVQKSVDLAVLMLPRDVYYYSGTAQPCNLLLPKAGDPLLQVRRAWNFVIKETSLPLSQLKLGGGVDEMIEMMAKLPFPVRTIGLTLDVIPAKLFIKLQKKFPECQFVDISPLILQQRNIKEAGELELVKKAANLYNFAHQAIMENLRPGMTEVELATHIGRAVRINEGESIVRNRRWDASLHPDATIACTPNTWNISGSAMTITSKGLSPSLAWGPSTTVISKGDLVVVDLATNYHGYHADICRTYVVGKADERQQEVFNLVLQLQDVALTALKSGVVTEDIYLAALKKAEELQVQQYFQGHGDMQGNYIGHGLGLEVDETPVLQLGDKTILRENMALAIEPKLIIPNWGAIMIEDNVIVTKEGYERISTVPRQLFEVCYSI